MNNNTLTIPYENGIEYLQWIILKLYLIKELQVIQIWLIDFKTTFR